MADGTNVHVVGYEANETGNYVAKYWKNGELTNLTDEKRDGTATALVVQSGDVYIAGTEGTTAKLWKNGVASNVSGGGTGVEVTDLFIDGQDVYVAGYESDGTRFGGVYWKNAVPTQLPESQFLYGIYVFKGDVYVCGTDYDHRMILWKNGIPTILADAALAVVPTSIIVIP